MQKENYLMLSQKIFRAIRRDLCFPSTNILGFLLQINITCLRVCCSLSLLPNWFSRSVLIQQVTKFLLWHDRLTWNLAGQAMHSYSQQLLRTKHFIPMNSLKKSFSPHWGQMDETDLKAYLLKMNIPCINGTREKLISKQLKTQKILFHPEKGRTLTAAVILKKTCFFQIQNICYETHGTEGSWSTQWMHITAVMVWVLLCRQGICYCFPSLFTPSLAFPGYPF